MDSMGEKRIAEETEGALRATGVSPAGAPAGVPDPAVKEKAFQDYYPDDVSQCYGCGRLNQEGLRIKSYWDGDETVCIFEPRSCHTAIPGYVYGGLIASLIDCHGTGTAAAAAYRAQGRAMDSQPPLRFLTASLQVDYLRPTPLGVPLEVRARVEEVKGRKVTVISTLSANGEVCARGRVVAVQMPEGMLRT
jgi:acyl-coenzyme A thioesterase PaaI-like protein